MLEIHNIGEDQHLIALNLGKAQTITGYYSLIHIIDLDDYTDQIGKLSQIIESFANHSALTNTIEVSRLKLKVLEDKLRTLNPYHRLKRGLIDGLGTAIKFVTGNMDINDAKTINGQIQRLESITANSQTLLKSQHMINSQMMQRFENLTVHINKEQHTLQKFINTLNEQTVNGIRKESTILNEMQYLSRLNYNIDLLTGHMSDIAEAVILAKLNIISKLILHPDELGEIRVHFYNQKINIISDEHLYELLELQTYYNNTRLIFNVKIPNFANETNILYHLIPLPINNTKQIVTKPYVSVGNDNIYHLTEICPAIEKMYYCKASTYIEETKNSTCISKILTNDTPTCALDNVGNVTKIFQPEANYIVFINVKPLLIKSNCSKTDFTVRGTALLHFKNCSVFAGGLEYKDNPSVHWDEVLIVPPNYNKLQASSVTETLTLEKLQHFDLQNQESILTLKEETTIKSNIILTTTTVLILLVIAALLLAWKKPQITYRTDPTPIVLSPPKSLWPSLYSKGGGVMLAHQPPPKPPRQLC